MPLFQADRCRVLATECRQLALAAETAIEKTLLTNLAFSWNRRANQTDRYVDFLKKAAKSKAASVGVLCYPSFTAAFLARSGIDFAPRSHRLHYHGIAGAIACWTFLLRGSRDFCI